MSLFFTETNGYQNEGTDATALTNSDGDGRVKVTDQSKIRQIQPRQWTGR